MTDETNLCAECPVRGRCCYHKTIWKGIPVFTEQHCKYFDPETKGCKDFENRFELGVGCLSVEEAIDAKALPIECLYLKDVKGYRAPILMETAEKLIPIGDVVKRKKLK